jgi:prepilin-type N-terminal cleavage/methylation domain-containing protein
MNAKRSKSCSPRAGCHGFTLVEVLFAVILVGMAIAGLTAANYAYSQSNGAGTDISTAEYLIEQIHEMTATMTVDQIYAYGGTGTAWRTAFAPINANGGSLGTTFKAWKQQIKVETLQKDLATADNGASPKFYRITVRATKNGQPISSATWLRARY